MVLNLTAEQWKLKARKEVGDISKNHIFEVRLPLAVNGGHWNPIFNGVQGYDIPFNGNRSAVLSSLESLSTIGPGQVMVKGIPKGPYYLEFQGDLGSVDLDGILTSNGAGLMVGGLVPDPPVGVTVSTSQIGAATAYESDADALWSSMDSGHVPYNIRYLVLKIELGKLKLGTLSGKVDTKDRDYEVKHSQQVAELRRLINDAKQEYDGYIRDSSSSGANASLTAKIIRRDPNALELADGTVFSRGLR